MYNKDKILTDLYDLRELLNDIIEAVQKEQASKAFNKVANKRSLTKVRLFVDTIVEELRMFKLEANRLFRHQVIVKNVDKMKENEESPD